MQKRAAYAATLVVLLVAVLLGGWWYFSNHGASSQDATVTDLNSLIRPHSPGEGRTRAPVVIVEFFDPACGTCRTFYPLVKQLMAEHPGSIRLVMRYAPFHKGSDKVVAVLQAAHRQGKFWPALEALFEGQDDWASNHTAKVDLTWKYLNGIGLNMEQLAFDLTPPDLRQAIEQDVRDANTLGVSQTPEYFVNGRRLPSFGLQQLQQLVADEMAKAH